MRPHNSARWNYAARSRMSLARWTETAGMVKYYAVRPAMTVPSFVVNDRKNSGLPVKSSFGLSIREM